MKKSEGKRKLREPRGWWENNINVGKFVKACTGFGEEF